MQDTSIGFWEMVERLWHEHAVVIDRPAGSAHPRFPDMIYPLDYGYLEGTMGGDGAGIDVWIGVGEGPKRVVGALATVDARKRDMELKLLVNCTDGDVRSITGFLVSNGLGVMLLHRETT